MNSTVNEAVTGFPIPASHVNNLVLDAQELFGRSVRQTVRAGAVDAAGAAAFLRFPTFTAEVPQMTGTTAPSGTVTCSSENTGGGQDAWHAFDRTPSGVWAPSSGTTGWVAYDWGTPKTITVYTVQAYSDGAFLNVNPKNWTFEGWNGSAWVVLDTQTNAPWTSASQVLTFGFTNATGYNKYRLNISANNGHATLLYLGDLQMYDLTSGTATGVDILGATVPLVTTLAAGVSTAGLWQDYQITVNSNVSGAWGSFAASTTYYLYQDRDTTTGVVTYGSTTLKPTYSPVSPTSPATGQHWFDLTSWQMKRWSGSAWVVFQRLFLGECTTNTLSQPTVGLAYALQGVYIPGRITASASTTYTKNHNLGTDLAIAQVHEATSAGGSLRPVGLTGLTATTYTLTTGAGVVEIQPIIRRAF